MTSVYLSSTFSDLEAHRRHVIDILRKLRYDVLAMEHYTAADERPADACLADVEACDLYIGIFAMRYGYIPPNDNPRGLSITELEYRHATALSKPRFIFMLEDGAPWPTAFIDAVIGEGAGGQKITALRAELSQAHLVEYFNTPETLALQVSVAMARWAGRQRNPQDARTTALTQALQAAIKREQALRKRGADTTAVRAEIRELKRQLRAGGQLQAGDFLVGHRFELLESLGQGGFAWVWKAHDQERRDIVALKVLHGQYAQDRTRRERFFRGARLMADLRHPGIASVYEAEVEDEGYYFFVMEYVAGGDFHQAVVGNHLSTGERLAVICAVGEALSYAHEQGLVHRDVKPANILLDAQGHPQLTDFDLVRANDTTGMTRTGMMGTFIYAAPELMSRPQDAGSQADVYGLAMTAVFALYGSDLPFEVMRDASGIIQQLDVAETVKSALTRGVDWELNQRWDSVAALCQALKQKDVIELEETPDATAAPEPTVLPPALPGPVDLPHICDPFLRGDGEGPEMVSLPGGTFRMGDDGSREVTLMPFAVGKYPVTFEEYDAFCESTGRENPSDMGWGRGRRPVINVSWHDAVAYAKWLSEQTGQPYGLLTEAQWEYACRAGSKSAYCFGDNVNQLDDYAWYGDNSDGRTHPVGEKRGNDWGLHDMHGNVWEWVEDRDEPLPAEAVVDPSGPGTDSLRVVRGGGWLNVAGYCRSSIRYADGPGARIHNLGFRLARTSPLPPPLFYPWPRGGITGSRATSGFAGPLARWV